LLSLSIALLSGATVYQQSVNTSGTDRGAFSQVGVQVVADDFQLLSSVTVNRVSWYGSYLNVDLPTGLATVDFTIGFHKDDNGLPFPDPDISKLVSANVTDLNIFQESRRIYQFSIDLSSAIVLPAGRHWFSVVESDDVTPDSLEGAWLWSISDFDPGSRAAAIENGVATLVSDRLNLAFTLEGTQLEGNQVVPEPGAALMLAGGLCALVLLKKRR
jgi:hypothetical protein